MLSSLHTNRLSTSVHSSKNVVHSIGILTNWKQIYSGFLKDFFQELKKNVAYLKTSTKERLFLDRSLRHKHLHPTFHLNFSVSSSRPPSIICLLCVIVFSNFARFHGIWLGNKVARARNSAILTGFYSYMSFSPTSKTDEGRSEFNMIY